MNYFILLKPRVMLLVIFTALVGLVLAPAATSLLNSWLIIVAISLGSGASGAINMWYDRDIDAVMRRTKSRPIPSGRVSAQSALVFGVSLAVASVALLWYCSNLLASSLLFTAIFIYTVVYTVILKRRSPHNIVIGGIAGAMPPMIGWVAATNSIDFPAFVLFLIIFLWTPPHSWALAILAKDDYARANVPMMPNVKGEAATKRQIIFYSLGLVLCSFLPVLFLNNRVIYLTVVSILNYFFLYYAIKVWRNSSYCRRMFSYSLLYLFSLFMVILLDALVSRMI